MAQYYPGPAYADWLGLSVYGQLFPGGGWDEFEDMVDKPYAELAAVDQTKPIMLAEWGVGEFPKKGNKAGWLTTGFDVIEEGLPRVRAAVYWHERWQNSNSLLYQQSAGELVPAGARRLSQGCGRSLLDRPADLPLTPSQSSKNERSLSTNPAWYSCSLASTSGERCARAWDDAFVGHLTLGEQFAQPPEQTGIAGDDFPRRFAS